MVRISRIHTKIHYNMRLRYFIYILSVAAVLFAATMVCCVIIAHLFPSVSVSAGGAILLGASIAAAASARPLLRRITGLRSEIQHKVDDLHDRYPVESEICPVKVLEFGDMLKSNGGDVFIYNGNAFKNHVLIPVKNGKHQEAVTVGADFLTDNVASVTCKGTTKWQKPQGQTTV